MIKAIIFDLDGTLLNTLEDLKNAINHALFSLNLPKITLEETRCFIGNGSFKLIERSLKNNYSEENFQKAFKLFTDYYKVHHMDNTVPYTGIKEVLNELKKDGFLLGVASNKRDYNVKELIQNLFPNIFDTIQGTYDDKPPKPDPYIMKLIFKNLKVKSEEVIYIGDTEVDYQTAVNTKTDYIIVSYGYRKEEEIKQRCPVSEFVSSTSSLYQEIKNRI